MANLNPCSNMTKVLEKFKVPGIDMTTMIEASRGDNRIYGAHGRAGRCAGGGIQENNGSQVKQAKVSRKWGGRLGVNHPSQRIFSPGLRNILHLCKFFLDESSKHAL
jgi:hypothetical protein